ncbi:MAG: hypothetical protein A2901_04390 [Elusimicrobia bacterium RIFCSPLOWO2_01_FULL_54_10]|nr:MAG: hypothetical protein A2901_04390 [Elusimicrobia bacterium RIFCSPLOWO2_01_FULL_54_10]
MKRDVFSWALYDFANSAFATTILAVIFNVYFVMEICKGGVPIMGRLVPGEALWGYVLGVSMLAVFVLAPVLGAVSDAGVPKKKFLAVFWCLGWVFSALLFFCRQGDWLSASIFFILANIGFGCGNSFYNSFLTDISTPANAGRISGLGWAFGYVGGGLLLAVNLLMLKQGFSVSSTFLSVGVWWALFGIPIFLYLREPVRARVSSSGSLLKKGFHDLSETFQKIKQYRETFKFLAAYLIYNDGIETVIVMASIFGARELGFSTTQLIGCFLMIQGVAFVGSLVFGQVADRFSHKKAIATTLFIYIGICFWAVGIKTQQQFWILGAVVGLVLGGSQAASRSLLSLLTPPEHSAQFFGFFALTGKLSSSIGPVVFGLIAQMFHLRLAVLSLAVFFAVGLSILYFVKEPETAPA